MIDHTRPSQGPVTALTNRARQVRNKGRSIPQGDDLVVVRPVWPPGMANTTFTVVWGKGM